MEAHGRVIHAKRAETIEKLGPIVARHYRAISGDREKVELSYRSELNGATFGEVLAAARDRDIANQFTTSGVHRDDMVMRIGGYPLKKYGSQGQQKSFLIALKLAHTSPCNYVRCASVFYFHFPAKSAPLSLYVHPAKCV